MYIRGIKPAKRKEMHIMQKAQFVRKVINLEELKEYKGETFSFIVEKMVELEARAFESFTERLLDDQDFIKGNKELQYIDRDGVWHCIMIKGKGRKDAILVQGEGYDWARYTAYLPSLPVSKIKA
jgi:hypothetical protein